MPKALVARDHRPARRPGTAAPPSWSGDPSPVETAEVGPWAADQLGHGLGSHLLRGLKITARAAMPFNSWRRISTTRCGCSACRRRRIVAQVRALVATEKRSSSMPSASRKWPHRSSMTPGLAVAVKQTTGAGAATAGFAHEAGDVADSQCGSRGPADGQAVRLVRTQVAISRRRIASTADAAAELSRRHQHDAGDRPGGPCPMRRGARSASTGRLIVTAQVVPVLTGLSTWSFINDCSGDTITVNRPAPPVMRQRRQLLQIDLPPPVEQHHKQVYAAPDRWRRSRAAANRRRLPTGVDGSRARAKSAAAAVRGCAARGSSCRPVAAVLLAAAGGSARTHAAKLWTPDREHRLPPTRISQTGRGRSVLRRASQRSC